VLRWRGGPPSWHAQNALPGPGWQGGGGSWLDAPQGLYNARAVLTFKPEAAPEGPEARPRPQRQRRVKSN